MTKYLVLLVLLLTAAGCATHPAQTARGDGAVFRDCADSCPEMVVIPGGNLLMGSPDSETGRDAWEGPQKTIAIRRLAVGRFDIIRGQWAAFVAATHRPVATGCAWASSKGPTLDPERSWQTVDFVQDDTHPVVCVSWGDAQDYVRWLRAKTGHSYRLLTEAEWEYAACAGSTTPFSAGETLSHDQANYGNDTCCSGLAAGKDVWAATSPVGSFPANGFGLYDMQGNVLQWTQLPVFPGRQAGGRLRL